MDKVIIASNVVPRDQHLGYLAGLYGCKEYIEEVILVGALSDSPAVQKTFKELHKVINISNYYVVGGIKEIGKARMKLFLQVLNLFKKGIYGSMGKYVLFVDDDCCLDVGMLKKMLDCSEYGGGVIGLQSEYKDNFGKLRGRPSFDFFCTLVPGAFVEEAAGNVAFMNILSRFISGGEFLFCDWYFRFKGCAFNAILNSFVLHLNIPDGYKTWYDWKDEKWNKLQDALGMCKSLEEAEKFLVEAGMIKEKK